MRNKKKKYTEGDTEAIPIYHFCGGRKDKKERKRMKENLTERKVIETHSN